MAEQHHWPTSRKNGRLPQCEILTTGLDPDRCELRSYLAAQFDHFNLLVTVIGQMNAQMDHGEFRVVHFGRPHHGRIQMHQEFVDILQSLVKRLPVDEIGLEQTRVLGGIMESTAQGGEDMTGDVQLEETANVLIQSVHKGLREIHRNIINVSEENTEKK